MAYAIYSTLMLAVSIAFLVNGQYQPGDRCDVGDHANNTGLYGPYPGDCSKYLQCLHGIYGEQSCSPGTHWNVEKEACDWPQKAGCITFNAEQKNVVGGPCTVGDHEDNLGLYVAHPNECGKYLQCLHGKFGERPCPEGLHWNSEETVCDWPQKANCLQNGNTQPIYPVPPIQNA